MFPETHKTISQNVCRDVCKTYDLKLNEKNYIWGSILPDMHPKYRSMSHYPEFSLDYIVGEISNLIYLGRFIDFENDAFYGISNKIFSRKLGIISHFLADFVCTPHYESWTFDGSLVKHVKYEKDLSKLSSDFIFKKNSIGFIDYIEDDNGNIRLDQMVYDFIHRVLEEYGSESGMAKDLEYAYNINLAVSEFVLETIILYNKEKALKNILVF